MTNTASDLAGLSLEAFTAHLASSDPTPGGGSAAAVAGSLAASLLAMVAGLSQGRPKYAAYEKTLARALAVAADARRRLLVLADDDARAYDAFSAALKLPREAPDEIAARGAALNSAARHATEVPLEIIRTCRLVAAELEALAGRSNLNASSDLTVGTLLVEAAARGAAANVLVNLPSVGDPPFEGATMRELTGHLELIEDLASQVRERVGRGKLRDPEEA